MVFFFFLFMCYSLLGFRNNIAHPHLFLCQCLILCVPRYIIVSVFTMYSLHTAFLSKYGSNVGGEGGSICVSVYKILYLYKVCVCGLWRLRGVCGSDCLPVFFSLFSLKAAKYVDMDLFYRSFLYFKFIRFPHIRSCQISFTYQYCESRLPKGSKHHSPVVFSPSELLRDIL